MRCSSSGWLGFTHKRMPLPLSLEGVGAVLGLEKQKLTKGKELIKYFCQPCAPTKANGGRTRNLPENAPDKWAAFKRYNVRDVEVEMSIQDIGGFTSIATELAKLQTARNKIRTKLVALGLVTAAAKLDDCATAVDGISNQGAVSATVQEGDTYTIPAGYHNGSGTVSGVAGGGNYKLQSKTVAPTKAQQAITPDSGYYGLSDVTVSQIPDAYQDVSSVKGI